MRKRGAEQRRPRWLPGAGGCLAGEMRATCLQAEGLTHFGNPLENRMQLVTFERLDSNAGGANRQHQGSASMGDTALGFETLEAVRPGQRRIGAILREGTRSGSIVDLNRAIAVKLASEDAGAPEAEADSLLPSDILSFLRRGTSSLSSAHAALAYVTAALKRYDGPDLVRAEVVQHRDALRLCAPVPRPGKILGVARNYPSHAAERGSREAPKEPVLFLKAPSSVIGPEGDILLPEVSKEVDFEGELAVVIGARAQRVSLEEALDCVAGYSIANDVTARDFQNQRGQHFLGKSCDSFAPLGPMLVTADEIKDPQDLAIHTTVSGKVMQRGHTKEMVFSVAETIRFASQLMTLEPGDVVFTGTPAGVGAARKPPRYLRDGDVVEVEVESLGRLRNYVRNARE